MRLIDADALQVALVEEGQANRRGKYAWGEPWELNWEEIYQTIINAPTIEPEQESGWIPVSERLPDADVSVLVTVYFKGNESEHHKPSYYVDVAKYNGAWYKFSGMYKIWIDRYEVIAWRPLPEPYKG